MGGAQDEALGAQDSQGETQHDLTLSLPRGRLALDRVKYIKVVLWSNFYPLIFLTYDVEFHERMKTPVIVCKYLH